jgi:hypothetical protein
MRRHPGRAPLRASRDGRDDVDGGARVDGGIEVGQVAVDEHVDVLADGRAGADEAVGDAGRGTIERRDDLAHRRRLDRDGPGHAREQREEGAAQQDVRHRA